MIKNLRVIIAVFFFLLGVYGIAAGQEELKPVAGIINVNSDVSDGTYSLETLSHLAQKKGIRVLMVTDHFLLRVEYGLPPLRGIIKKRREEKSAVSCGIRKYLERIREVNRTHPEVLIVPGVKVTPCYYWSGSPFNRNLTLHNLHKEMLVIGLEEPQAYRRLPVIGNHLFVPLVRLLFSLWPVGLIFAGGWLMIKFFRSSFSSFRKLGGVLIFIGALFLFNNLALLPYNQYYGDPGILPYQTLADYVRKRGGAVFWSAPESASVTEIDSVKISTLPYPDALVQTSDYTGFASLYEGYRTAGGVGGTWDRVLTEYCADRRRTPVWTIGELDFHSPEEKKEIDEVQTVFLLSGKVDKEAVMDALKRGKCYALRKTEEYQLVLRDFTVTAPGGIIGRMGDTVEVKGSTGTKDSPGIRFSIGCSDKRARQVAVKVVSAGKVIKEFKENTPMEVRFNDEPLSGGEKRYYRLDVETQYPHKILTNPIFAVKK